MALKSRISVQVLDAAGTLEVDHSGTPVQGVWDSPSFEIVPNNPITLRMQMEPNDTDFVEVSGLVVADAVRDFAVGAEFNVDVLRISRAPRTVVPNLPEGFDELPTLALPQSPVGLGIELSEFETKTKAQTIDIPTLARRSDAQKSEKSSELEADTVMADNPFLDSHLFSELSSENETTSPAKRVATVSTTELGPINKGSQTSVGDSSMMSMSEEASVEEPTGILGTLKEMALADLVQSLELARKTAQLVISPREGDPGSVFIEAGRVVWAECGNHLGEDAFYQLARSTRGSFRMRFHVTAPGKNIHSPTQFLLLEALRRVDEGRNSGDIALESVEGKVEKEALPSAREVVDAARRRAKRKKRRRKKESKNAKAKEAKAKAPQETTSSKIVSAVKEVAIKPPPKVTHEERQVRKTQSEKTTQAPSPKSSGLFSGFFDEAEKSND